MYDVKLPEVGENIESGNVVSVLVNIGDTVKKDQDLIELETDKASIPVPSPAAGVVKEILVSAGDSIHVGQVYLRLETSTPASTSQPATPPPAAPAKTSETPAAPNQPTETRQEKPQPIPSSSEPQQAYQNVVVIGGGPGGYAAAFLAADLGLNVTLVDAAENPGGVCLYRGCIPSKALLHAAKVISETREAKVFGLDFGTPQIDIDKLRSWKDGVVNRLTGGLGQLTQKRKINYIQGYAKFVDSNTISVKKVDGSEETVTYERAVLATGSRPIELPFAPKSDRILDSTSALALDNVPQSMLLVGGGYIGLELGTVYAEFGTKVSVVEMMPQLITGADPDLASILVRRLKTIMDKIMVSTKVLSMDEVDGGIKVTFEDKDGQKFDETYEKVLVAIGRKPNTNDIGLENTKIVVNQRGFIDVNEHLQTSDPAIYAIGDIVGQPMLAHKASHEGRVAVEHIAGHKVAFEPQAIPAVVFTDPEIAWAGLTETEAKAQGVNFTAVKFPWGASGRAMTLDRQDGLTKILVDPETERVLGVSIVGPGAGEMIAEGTLAIEMGCTISDLKLTIHAHPTLSETVMEAAESFFGQSTHTYRPKRNS